MAGLFEVEVEGAALGLWADAGNAASIAKIKNGFGRMAVLLLKSKSGINFRAKPQFLTMEPGYRIEEEWVPAQAHEKQGIRYKAR